MGESSKVISIKNTTLLKKIQILNCLKVGDIYIYSLLFDIYYIQALHPVQIHEYHHFNRVISSKVNSTLQLFIHTEERRSAQPTSTLFRSYKMKMEDVSVEKRVRKTNRKSGVLLCGVRSSRSNWRLHTERLCQQLNQPQNHKKYPHFRPFLLTASNASILQIVVMRFS